MDKDALRLSKKMCRIFEERHLTNTQCLNIDFNKIHFPFTNLKAIDKCIENNWNSAIKLVKNRLIQTLKNNMMTMQSFIKNIDEHYIDKIDIKDIYLQIIELKQIFGESNVNCICSKNNIGISCRTNKIILEDVLLGRFDIIIDIQTLSVTICPIDPNYASGKESVCHPHVQDEKMCMGSAKYTIEEALQRFDILSAFEQINNILHTYNPNSPFVSLEEWDDGCCCCRCNYGLSEDEVYLCTDCSEPVCSDCCNFCCACHECYCLRCYDSYSCDSCSNTYCPTCFQEMVNQCDICKENMCSPTSSITNGCTNFTECENCNKTICDECTITCSICGENICTECVRDNNLCEECLNSREHQESTVN